jgi:hypothetical protein
MFEYYFDRQIQPQETIISIIRPSIWHVRSSVYKIIGLVLLACFLIYPASRIGAIGWWLIIGFLGTALLLVIRVIIIQQLTACLLTTHRLIDIERSRLFDQQVAELSLEHIQDIRYNKKGFLATIADYGTVVVQASAGRGRIELVNVRKPSEVHELLMKAHRQYTTDVSFIQVRE